MAGYLNELDSLARDYFLSSTSTSSTITVVTVVRIAQHTVSLSLHRLIDKERGRGRQSEIQTDAFVPSLARKTKRKRKRKRGKERQRERERTSSERERIKGESERANEKEQRQEGPFVRSTARQRERGRVCSAWVGSACFAESFESSSLR